MKERIPSLGTDHTAPPIETRPITPPRYIQPESKNRGLAGCLKKRTEMKKEKIKKTVPSAEFSPVAYSELLDTIPTVALMDC